MNDATGCLQRLPKTPGCRDCRLIDDCCGKCEREIRAMGRRRPAAAMEVDALNSILRVLEPLDAAARERCLAAARTMTNQLAALAALDAPEWGGAGLTDG